MPKTHKPPKVNLKHLKAELEAMTERSLLYHLIKRVLTERNRWKVKKRGNPEEGYRIRKAQLDRLPLSGMARHQETTYNEDTYYDPA